VPLGAACWLVDACSAPGAALPALDGKRAWAALRRGGGDLSTVSWSQFSRRKDSKTVSQAIQK
jgi:hypothetical protein